MRAGTVLAPRRLPRALARALPLLTRFLLLELEPGEEKEGMGNRTEAGAQSRAREQGKSSEQSSTREMESSG